LIDSVGKVLEAANTQWGKQKDWNGKRGAHN